MAATPAPPAAHARAVSPEDAALGAALVLATFAVYWPALQGGILIDDPDHITRPEWRSLAGLARLWFEIGITSQYFPLLHTAFWLEYHLWQDAVVGYHVANVVQHVLSAGLLVALMRRLEIRGAWFAGFIFALHPVCVESVAWISEQKNTLSTLLYLSAGYAYLGFDRHRRASCYWLASGLFVLALLTKSITATLVPALLVVFWWQRGRLEWRRDLRPLLPWLLAGAAFGLFTAWYEQVYANARGASFDLSLLERGLIAGRALVFYARTLLWPSDLMFINPRWAVDASVAWQYAYPALVLAVAFVLVWHARRRRAPLAAFLIYAGTLFPTLGFLNINWFNYSFVADHFQYLASPGLIVPAAGGLTALAARLFAGRPRILTALPAALLLLGLGFLSWRQSGHYRDGETLYRHTLARNPASWIAHHNLGALLLDRPGRLDEAIAHLTTTLALKPNHLRAHNNLGYAYSRIPGRLPDAIRAFEASLRLKPDDPRITLYLAHARAQLPGHRDEAIATYRRALELSPSTWEAHVGLGQQLGLTPDGLPEAIAQFQAAIRLQPGRVTLHMDLGVYLARAGRLAEARRAFETAARLQPDWDAPRHALGQLPNVAP